MIELNRCLEISRTGIPADFYYHNDINRPDLPDYKLYVFVNCFSLTKDERQAIKDTVRRRGKTALFIYGQGYVEPCGQPELDAGHVSDLTGMRIRQINKPSLGKFRIDPDGFLSTDCDPGTVYGQLDRQVKDGCAMYLDNQTTVVCPLLVCDDPDAVTAATLCAEKLPAVSVLSRDGYNTVFTAAKWITADVYRAIGRLAGCHVFGDGNDFIFANERYLTIHAAKTGRKHIRLKANSTPYEVYENRAYAENVSEFEFDMIRGQTKMFRL